MTEPTYEQLKARVAEYESATERERKPDWEKWLNELAATIVTIPSNDLSQPQINALTEAARQLRYMATSFTPKANFVRYNLEIRKWWWRLGDNDHAESFADLYADTLADMESFMREQSIQLEKPISME